MGPAPALSSKPLPSSAMPAGRASKAFSVCPKPIALASRKPTDNTNTDYPLALLHEEKQLAVGRLASISRWYPARKFR